MINPHGLIRGLVGLGVSFRRIPEPSSNRVRWPVTNHSFASKNQRTMKTTCTFTLIISLLTLLSTIGCKNPESTVEEPTTKNEPIGLASQIALGETSGAKRPEGWNEFSPELSECSMVWPSEVEPSLDTSVDLDDGDLTFVFGTSERDEDHQRLYTGESMSNMIEAGARVGDQKLLSESKQDGDLFVRMFANQSDQFTQIGRVYVAKSRYWFIAATVKNGKESDPRIQFFFENFKPAQ